MIVSVSDAGTLELFWRHPVSKNPNREKAVDFISRFRHGSEALNIPRTWLERRPARQSDRSYAQTLDLIVRAISRGECVVLQHRSETRWHGTRLPVVAISSSVLMLSRARTRGTRDLDAALQWLNHTASPDDIFLLWKMLWVRYGRSDAEAPPPIGEFSAEIERLLKSGELVPVFHPLPVMVATVVASRPAAGPSAAPAKPPPPDPATFDGNHPGATQASTLQRAAQSGAAFCEVCNRMAASNAKLTWIAIVLLDSDKKPVAGQAYEIELPDGSVVGGVTNAGGKARHDNIPAGQCKVRFPDLDGGEWKLAG